MSIQIQYFQTLFGEMIIGSFNQKICLIDWRYRKMRESIDQRLKKQLNAEFEIKSNSVQELAKKQLQEYFDGQRRSFELDLLLVGSPFQKKVWEELQNIPFGETISYLELSKKLGNEKAIRAVASANGANAISIVVPCHRVIGSDGQMTGYAGGILAKERLLQIEGVLINGQTRLF